jgi:hypothetical protein
MVVICIFLKGRAVYKQWLSALTICTAPLNLPWRYCPQLHFPPLVAESVRHFLTSYIIAYFDPSFVIVIYCPGKKPSIHVIDGFDNLTISLAMPVFFSLSVFEYNPRWMS